MAVHTKDGVQTRQLYKTLRQHLEVVKVLLAQDGININTRLNILNTTPLNIAIQNFYFEPHRYVEVIVYLVFHGAVMGEGYAPLWEEAGLLWNWPRCTILNLSRSNVVDRLSSIYDVDYTAILAFRTCLCRVAKEEGIASGNALRVMSMNGYLLVPLIGSFLVPCSIIARRTILYLSRWKATD